MDYERANVFFCVCFSWILCFFHGYGLAEIPTEEVYDAVHGYVKANWHILLDFQASTFVNIWLGSRYDVS